jgi:hypothetical protein
MQRNRFTWLGLTVACGLSFGSLALAASEDAPPAGLVEVVLRSTHQFRDPQAAKEAGYGAANACVSGPQEGAMGEHFINGDLLFDGQLDPQRPEALIYEVRGGRTRLVGVEYIVIAEAWHTNNGAATPALMGQLMHYVGSPNRYGLPPFYELHVWAWKFNPSGMFVDWNPKVSCAEFKPETPSVAAVQGHSHGAPAQDAKPAAATAAPASAGGR